MQELIKRLQEGRLRVWEQAKAVIDEAENAKRSMTPEENEKFEALNADLDAVDARIKDLVEREERSRSVDELFNKLGVGVPAAREDAQDAEVRKFLSGEGRALEFKPERRIGTSEFRALSKLSAGAGANTVPTSFYDQLVAHLIEVSGILNAGPTVLQTNSGETIQIPKTTSHSTAALVAERGTIAQSDPAFGQVSLGAFKYGVLTLVSRELITDTAVDLLGYLAMQCGRAVGNALGTDLVVGDGSAKPQGLIPVATLGVTGGAGVAGAFTADNLIDLMFSVIAPYRNSPSCGWLMKDATLGAVRKLKDSAGYYLFTPAATVGAPDTLLGKQINTDPNVAAVALSAKSVAFGDISRYFIRMVSGIRFERSDDFAFDTDTVAFRCLVRADGNLIDRTGAVKYFAGNAA